MKQFGLYYEYFLKLCRDLRVFFSTLGGHISILMNTTNTGTLRARDRPRCSLVISTVVGSKKSLSPRIKSSNDDFYTNRRSDKFSITYPKSAEIHFGEKYLSLFQKTYFVGKIHNLQIFPMAHQHLSTHQECAGLSHARKLLTRDASKASV